MKQNRKCEMENSKCEMENRKCKMENRKYETIGSVKKCEMENRKCEMENRNIHRANLRTSLDSQSSLSPNCRGALEPAGLPVGMPGGGGALA